MGWFRNLFAPEIDRLTKERDWYVGQVTELAGELKNVRIDARLEFKRHVKAERELVNQVLELGGGRRLPKDEAAPNTQPDLPLDVKGEETAQDLLARERAIEYIKQRSDEELSEENIDRVQKTFLADPQHWLVD